MAKFKVGDQAFLKPVSIYDADYTYIGDGSLLERSRYCEGFLFHWVARDYVNWDTLCFISNRPVYISECFSDDVSTNYKYGILAAFNCAAFNPSAVWSFMVTEQVLQSNPTTPTIVTQTRRLTVRSQDV